MRSLFYAGAFLALALALVPVALFGALRDLWRRGDETERMAASLSLEDFEAWLSGDVR